MGDFKKNKLAFCGNNCSLCPRFIATESSDIEQLKKVALMWKSFGFRDTVESIEKITCHGCSANVECRYGINRCAIERNVINCGKCNHYPCDKVSDAFKRTKIYAKKFSKICSTEEYEVFLKAFFSKKKNLDKAFKE